MTFARPLLLLLIPVALALLGGSLAFLRPRERKRRIFPAVIRALLIILVVAALAGPRTRQTVEGRAVAILLDVSESIPDEVRPGIESWLVKARAGRHAEDAEAVILFGSGAGVEVPFATEPGEAPPPFDFTRPRSRVGRFATDIAGAIRLARASFPEGLAGRIVLVTDGNENRGDGLAEARRAAGDGVEILALPIHYRREAEVSAVRLDAPASVAPGSVASFTPILSSSEPDRSVLLRAFVDGRELDRRQAVLPRGKSRGPEFRVLFDAPGVHELSVVVDAEGDRMPENNEVKAGVTVRGQAGILVSESGGSHAVLDSLRAMGIAAAGVPPVRLYDDPLYYLAADAIVLSDVAALDLSVDQLEAIEVAVRDLGVGLVVLGGDRAYGPGGYGGTALERCLPVRMDVREKQVLLNGALVCILHSCEFQEANYWSLRIAQDSIRALSPSDYAGIVIFGVTGDTWALPLQLVRDPAGLAASLEDLRPQDMPSFDSSLSLAAKDLRDCPAYLKHIVVISDGDAAPPDSRLISAIARNRITVSAVCIAPHRPSDTQAMKDIARWGDGRYYEVDGDDLESLPRIFVKEATTLRRNTVRLEPFLPQWTVGPKDLPAALKGFGGELPELGGYSLTEAKDRTEVPLVTPDGDPVLAFWRYGLGKVAAFTSAVKEKWIGAWAGWADLDRFLAQIVRSTFREAGHSGFRAESEVRGGVATVRIEALSDTGDELDFLRFTAFATRPGEEPRPLSVVAKGGGTYEASFPVEGDRSYAVVARYEEPGTGNPRQLVVPVAVSYPDEYADLATNDAFFARLRDEAGGRILDPTDDIFAGETVHGVTERSLAPLLLLLAALLLPFDVFVRRVAFDPRPWLARLLPKLPSREEREERRRARRLAKVGEEAVPDAPDAPDAPEPPPEKEPEAPPKPEDGDEPRDAMKGLLDAKKRARRRGRWEETGN